MDERIKKTIKTLLHKDKEFKLLYDEYIIEKSKLVENAPDFEEDNLEKNAKEKEKTIRNGKLVVGKKVYSFKFRVGKIEKIYKNVINGKNEISIFINFYSETKCFNLKDFLKYCILEGDGNILFECPTCGLKLSREEGDECPSCKRERMYKEYVIMYGDKKKVEHLLAQIILLAKAEIEKNNYETTCHGCGAFISKKNAKRCFKCGWLKCPKCGACGCK